MRTTCGLTVFEGNVRAYPYRRYELRKGEGLEIHRSIIYRAALTARRPSRSIPPLLSNYILHDTCSILHADMYENFTEHALYGMTHFK